MPVRKRPSSRRTAADRPPYSAQRCAHSARKRRTNCPPEPEAIENPVSGVLDRPRKLPAQDRTLSPPTLKPTREGRPDLLSRRPRGAEDDMDDFSAARRGTVRR